MTIQQNRQVDGGCEAVYAASGCVWGVEPEPLLEALTARYPVDGRRVYDAGCGEGRNAVHLARQGAHVTAVDVSARALRNAAETWPGEPRVEWRQADVLTTPPERAAYDVVLCDSVIHWLVSHAEARQLVRVLQDATRPGGAHLLCSFNDRAQDLSGHDNPPRLLLGHDRLLELYQGWEIWEVRDEDISSSHEGAWTPHRHSVTKFLARAPLAADGGTP
ncbi:hypothetical protein Aph01nite_35920 [Acrocarpospora phusangensis]|uniref:Methyltransferase domain-containing protein n=1 Tax=Acrocarpospora phusangensis TaxID=1070424 RepID=A0A919QAD3_9ACTN|nr:class I SAM-dependent methyltransferase [Acrocarpospora phusangensis]GIH25282.1 hypothetical protein Aph01nite_35920 [Acrocarpospora phusangensis]